MKLHHINCLFAKNVIISNKIVYKPRWECISTITDECKELEVLDKGLSIRRASEKFNVPKSTVADIKKNKEK
jgi:hypothetical protein